MKKYKYVYHVVYFYTDNNKNTGVGSLTLYRDCQINTEEEINSVVEFISKEKSFTNVVLLNYILLNERGK